SFRIQCQSKQGVNALHTPSMPDGTRHAGAAPGIQVPHGRIEPYENKILAAILSLKQAIREMVHDGDTVALEGFTHLIPFAAGYEIIRQGKRDLIVIRMPPDLIYDQLIGAGCVKKI